MYRAKAAAGTSFDVFSEHHSVMSRDPVILASEVQSAIEARQLVAALQPKLDVS